MKRSKAESLSAKSESVETPSNDPYQLLADFGVTDNSSMADVHRAGMNAQRRGALTPERSRAWRELRDPEKRLVLDLFRFQPAPDAFGNLPLTQPNQWELLAEIVANPKDPLTTLPLPTSFLEDLK